MLCFVQQWTTKAHADAACAYTTVYVAGVSAPMRYARTAVLKLKKTIGPHNLTVGIAGTSPGVPGPRQALDERGPLRSLDGGWREEFRITSLLPSPPNFPSELYTQKARTTLHSLSSFFPCGLPGVGMRPARMTRARIRSGSYDVDRALKAATRRIGRNILGPQLFSSPF